VIAHHGGEFPLLQAALASAGAVPVLLFALRAELRRLVDRFTPDDTQEERR
jgi:hypothetical protein